MLAIQKMGLTEADALLLAAAAASKKTKKKTGSRKGGRKKKYGGDLVKGEKGWQDMLARVSDAEGSGGKVGKGKVKSRGRAKESIGEEEFLKSRGLGKYSKRDKTGRKSKKKSKKSKKSKKGKKSKK